MLSCYKIKLYQLKPYSNSSILLRVTTESLQIWLPNPASALRYFWRPAKGGKPWDGNGRRSLWWKKPWASCFQSLFSHDSVSEPPRNKDKPCLWKNFGRLGKYSYDREWVLYMTVHVNPLYMPLFHCSHECGSHAGPQKPFRTKHLGRYGESPNFQTCQLHWHIATWLHWWMILHSLPGCRCGCQAISPWSCSSWYVSRWFQSTILDR